MQTIILPQDQIDDLEALEMLAESVGRITGATVVVETQTVIRTENIPAWLAMKSLLEEKTAAVDPARGNGKPTRNVRSWSLNGSGEKLTGREVSRRLADHSFTPGTILHHPKHGTRVVVRADVAVEPDRLVERDDQKPN